MIRRILYAIATGIGIAVGIWLALGLGGCAELTPQSRGQALYDLAVRPTLNHTVP